MELRKRKIDEVSLTLINDFDNNYNEIAIFKGLLKKIKGDHQSVGFNKKYNKQEIELIRYLDENILEDEKPKN